MKISDLLLERETRERFDDYVKRLVKKHKISKLGSGMYADVFQHPDDPNIAVKVYKSENDSGYNNYLKWCLQNQGNKFVPRILHFEKIKARMGPDYTIVFFEKLLDLETKEYRSFVKWVINFIGEEPDGHIPEYENKLMDMGSDDWQEVIMTCKDRDFVDFARYMAKRRGFDGNDLHIENIMKRPNGQLVIVDPFA